MKKVLIFLVCSVFTLQAQTNLLPQGGNYGFEEGTATNAYWWYLNGSPTYATFEKQNMEVHSGNSAYQLNMIQQGANKWSVQIVSSQNSNLTYPTIEESVSYTLQFWMKTTNGSGTVRVSNAGNSPYSADVNIEKGQWKLYSFEFSGNGTTYRPSIDIGTAAVGTYYIDDIALYKTSSLSTTDIVGKERSIAISPNPVTNTVYLNRDVFSGPQKIKIVDSTGRIVISKEVDKSFDVSQLSRGIYFIVTDSGRAYKFIKN